MTSRPAETRILKTPTTAQLSVVVPPPGPAMEFFCGAEGHVKVPS